GVAVDTEGALYIADTNDQKIRLVSGGVISTVAGDGTLCGTPTGTCGDTGSPTSAQLGYPSQIALDGDDNLFIADQNNDKVRELRQDNVLFTVAGSGTSCLGE